jgi:tRNA/tmRNA/rRNA uracil-C5-methylase (TrmA/RlmC/RlmD family)
MSVRPGSAVQPIEGDVVVLTLGSPANGGSNVSRRTPEDKVIFVEGGIEGETVRARITRSKSSESFLRARVTEVLEASEHRREHPWPLADPMSGSIGGAELGHVDPVHQRDIKARAANDALLRIGRFDESELRSAGLLPSIAQFVEIPSGSAGARTRVAFAVGPGGSLGMHPSGSSDVVPVDDMPMAVDRLRSPELFNLDFTGLERVELAAGTDDVLVLLIPQAARRPVRGRRNERRTAPVSISEARLRRLADDVHEILGARVAAWWPLTQRLLPLVGEPELRQSVAFTPQLTQEFVVTGDGFWQIHEGAPERLSRAVMGLMGLEPGDRLADLYAGAGLFTGAILAQSETAGVEGISVDSIEAYPVTSRDAAETFGSDARVNVVTSKVEDALGGRAYDAVVLDPSRVGAGADAVAAIAATNPSRIVYVSCDAGSFARDARLLKEAGYRMDHRELFDIYPDTHHVETVARFTRGLRG